MSEDTSHTERVRRIKNTLTALQERPLDRLDNSTRLSIKLGKMPYRRITAGGLTVEESILQPTAGTLVLFGGYTFIEQTETTVTYDDTWIWNGTSWYRQLTLTTPPSRSTAATARGAGMVVMFGGWQVGNILLNDTWIWDGSIWKAGPSAPLGLTPRYGAIMGYDGTHFVLFGGYDDNNYLNDTWLWDGISASWTQYNPPSDVSGRSYSSVASYDNTIIVFGGFVSTESTNDILIWNGSNWTQHNPPLGPPPMSGTCIAYDGTQIVLFGGQIQSAGYTNETWLLNINTLSWTRGTTPADLTARAYGVAANDGERIVLFGGYSPVSFYNNDTWLWNGSSWSKAETPTELTARSESSMA